MATVTFDTHKFARRLKESGFDEKQAEAISDAFREAQSETEPLTKKDFKIENTAMRSGLLIVKWMVGLVFTAEAMPLLAQLLG